MVAYTKTLKVGEGFEDGVFLGPVQNEMQYDRVQGFFDDVEKHGMKVAVGGKVPDSNGYFSIDWIAEDIDVQDDVVEIYKKSREGLKIIKTEERILYKSQQKSKPILSMLKSSFPKA